MISKKDMYPSLPSRYVRTPMRFYTLTQPRLSSSSDTTEALLKSFLQAAATPGAVSSHSTYLACENASSGYELALYSILLARVSRPRHLNHAIEGNVDMHTRTIAFLVYVRQDSSSWQFSGSAAIPGTRVFRPFAVESSVRISPELISGQVTQLFSLSQSLYFLLCMPHCFLSFPPHARMGDRTHATHGR